MSNPIKTTFKNAVGAKAIPTKGSPGVYDREPNVDSLPGRDTSPNCPPLKYRDTAATSGEPSTSGPIKSIFKKAVS